jgi:uncharacterized membrane protein/mono/diheme cytochrome c family protein
MRRLFPQSELPGVANWVNIPAGILLILFFTPINLFAQAPESGVSSHWIIVFLGRLHPMIVHFPLSLFYVALIFDLLDIYQKSEHFRKTVSVLIILGACSSVLAVIFGLLLAESGEYSADAVSLHRWTGILTAVLSLLIWISGYLFNGKFRTWILLVTVLAVTVAGHQGAKITHGEEFLSEVFTSTENEKADPSVDFDFNNAALVNDEDKLQALNVQVRTILAHHCYNCHGAAKVKGSLRLDSKQAIFKGGKHGPVIIAGAPEKSELIRRIRLPKGHKDIMPSKGELLSSADINLLENWIRIGAPWPAGPERSIYRTAALAPRLPEIPEAGSEFNSPIDRFVSSYFEKINIAWKPAVDDRVYIRRVYLDVIGLMPTADSINAFLKDNHPEKRLRLVASLLNRNDDYAQHWLSFWNDALRNDYTGTGYITGGRSDITSWLYSSLKKNKPFHQFVKELISPAPESQGFIRGIQWRGVVNASQRTEMQAAQNVAQVFLGLNLKCASCHDSFISDWKLDDAYAFANIFADSTLEINRCDKPTGRYAGTKILYGELGNINASANRSDRLKQLADSIVQLKNGRLYRTLVNRMWRQVMGRGLVEPVDMMDNAPWDQDLLDWLAWDFANSGQDIKKLLFQILTSRAYQLPSVDMKDPATQSSSGFVFQGMVRRRLSAEQFSDAVSSSLSPVYPDSLVVYRLLPENIKSSIPFPRASLVINDPFLKALGRPNRETVITSRESEANLLQALEFTNGDLFNRAVESSAKNWVSQYRVPKNIIDAAYNRVLGRAPLPDEMKIAIRSFEKNSILDSTEDLLWSLTLHPEFQLIY